MQHAERIFEAFERATAGSKVPGTGLGLAIVKRIVEMDGGRIWAESQQGQGSRFGFALPMGLEKKGPVAEGRDLRRVRSSNQGIAWAAPGPLSNLLSTVANCTGGDAGRGRSSKGTDSPRARDHLGGFAGAMGNGEAVMRAKKSDFCRLRSADRPRY